MKTWIKNLFRRKPKRYPAVCCDASASIDPSKLTLEEVLKALSKPAHVVTKK